eukprot:scaffold1762_cov383-Prasinococcus_capsulatus_cf.AAC.8
MMLGETDYKDVAAGAAAARACAVQVLSQLQGALGSLDRIVRLVKLTGFVNAAGAFDEHSKARLRLQAWTRELGCAHPGDRRSKPAHAGCVRGSRQRYP